MKEDCRQVLEMSLIEGKKAKEVADQMGYSSAGYARKKRYECNEKWKELIKSDPRFGGLKF
ncbi:MAG: hypothetical protein IPJ40_23935 [Saprospirales bacterium]|nr:hypothetical protein [Saprospirales bacterium]